VSHSSLVPSSLDWFSLVPSSLHLFGLVRSSVNCFSLVHSSRDLVSLIPSSLDLFRRSLCNPVCFASRRSSRQGGRMRFRRA
jgi:hypothetical protein